jgi:hypothetical protein
MKRAFPCAFRAALLLNIFLVAEFAAAAITYQPIAISASAGANLGLGPNIGDASVFGSFGDPSLNSSGQVAFRGRLTPGAAVTFGNDTGIWTSIGGTLTPLAREGSDQLGPHLDSGVAFADFFTPSSMYISPQDSDVLINNAGTIAFNAGLTGTDSPSSQSIWTAKGTALTLVVRTGPQGTSPNVESGTYFRHLSEPFLNASGAIAFDAKLTPTGALVFDGSWSNRGGALAPIARAGSAGPGPNVGAGFQFYGVVTSGFNDSGQTTLHGSLDATSTKYGVWLGGNGTNSAIAVANFTAGFGPNLGAGVTFSDLSREPAVLNRAGQVAVVAQVAGTSPANDTGIWSNIGGSWHVVAQEGSTTFGPNVGANLVFDDFPKSYDDFRASRTYMTINSAGRIVFDAHLVGAGVTTNNNSGLWTNPNGQLTAIVRTGTETLGPNLGAGVTFAAFGNYGMNSRGSIVFAADLAGTGIDDSNNSGIWIWRNGTLTKIVREGDVIDIDPRPTTQDLRTVGSVAFVGSGGEDGHQSAFNDGGEIVYKLGFANGLSAIFSSQILLPGDFNFDGLVNSADLSEMLKALTDLKGYQAKYSLTDSDLRAVGDINQDYNSATGKGGMNNRDIQPFLALLQSQGNGSLEAVPEPASFWLACTGLTIVIGARKRKF